jgi:hypothetical protein
MSRNEKFYIVVDFDGTIVGHEYPKIGKPIPHAIEVLQRLSQRDHIGIILYTMRCKETLDEAVDYCETNKIKLFGVNQNPSQYHWTQSVKPYGNLYIDDAAFGCLLLFDKEISNRPFVDWVAVWNYLRETGVLDGKPYPFPPAQTDYIRNRS